MKEETDLKLAERTLSTHRTEAATLVHAYAMGFDPSDGNSDIQLLTPNAVASDDAVTVFTNVAGIFDQPAFVCEISALPFQDDRGRVYLIGIAAKEGVQIENLPPILIQSLPGVTAWRPSTWRCATAPDASRISYFMFEAKIGGGDVVPIESILPENIAGKVTSTTVANIGTQTGLMIGTNQKSKNLWWSPNLVNPELVEGTNSKHGIRRLVPDPSRQEIIAIESDGYTRIRNGKSIGAVSGNFRGAAFIRRNPVANKDLALIGPQEFWLRDSPPISLTKFLRHEERIVDALSLIDIQHFKPKPSVRILITTDHGRLLSFPVAMLDNIARLVQIEELKQASGKRV